MKIRMCFVVIPVILFISGCNGVTNKQQTSAETVKPAQDTSTSDGSRAEVSEIIKISSEGDDQAQKAANFILPDLDGNLIRFSDLKGKVIILDFWATWCPPCRDELPHFKSLYQQYQDQGLEIVGIALDQGGVRVVKPFIEDNKITYTILISNQEVTEAYGGIRGIPTTFIIDRQGRIIEKYVGYRDKEVFESAIKQLF